MRALLARLREAAAQGSPQTRAAAVEALGRAPAALLTLLDRYARVPDAGSPHPDRCRARPAPPGGDAPSSDLLGALVASLDPDGRVRQAAVEALATAGGPLPAAASALRAVDRVPQVAERARAALLARTAPDEVPAAVGVLLAVGGRRRAHGLLGAYRSVLAEPARRRAVRALAGHADPPVRRFGVELALDLGEYVRGDLLRTALHDTDQVCRRLCAQRLLELDPEQAGRLLWASGAGVRELAVSALPADVPATRLVAPLADRALMVRAQARWKLYQRGEPPADVYRKQVRKAARRADGVPGLLAGLATGLGECGDAADVELLAPLLPDPRAMVRRAAARAVGRLARPCELVPLLAPLANDPDPGVAREVFRALARVPDDVPPETLWIGRTRTEPAVRRLAERIGAARAAGYAQSGQSPR
ncbi:HEAT repeat domain-containing protein [Actinacidiphila reveromycinica]|uniref:HEAT repeat domain-containing protein n=1 Tax=Actinacidiphila reveromycinica TaxID=659352 RepID=UPI001F3A48F7|nr:HEAT repeat domain-containing protein [Streptomyces sp. SN-593]